MSGTTTTDQHDLLRAVASREHNALRGKLALEDLRHFTGASGSYGQWWGSDLGHELYIAITEDIGRPMTRKLRRTHGSDLEPLDVANTAVALLAKDCLLAAILSASNPMAYLATTLQNALGVAGAPHTDFIENPALVGDRSLKVDDVEDRATSAHPALRIEIAEQLTAACLRPHTPARLRDTMTIVVSYFSAAGESRIAHALTNAVTDDDLLQHGIGPGEIRAIGNAVLGSRSYGHRNSLLGAFIQDNTFDPTTSRDHSAAIAKYARRVRGIAIT